MSDRARKDPVNYAPSIEPMGSLLNTEPGRHYVWTHAEDGAAQNHQYYETLGYRLERKTKGGVQVVQGQKVKEGDPLKFWDMVLMSCSEERKSEIDEYGPHGNTGHALNRRIQKKINVTGLQKEISSRIARVENQTTPLMVES